MATRPRKLAPPKPPKPEPATEPQAPETALQEPSPTFSAYEDLVARWSNGDPSPATGGGDLVEEIVDEFLPWETFHNGLCMFFRGAGAVAAIKVPGGLDTLRNAPDADGALEASQELYALCCDNEAMHWLVSKDSGALARYIPIGVFAAQVGIGTVAEIRDKMPKPEPITAPPPSEAIDAGGPATPPAAPKPEYQDNAKL